MAPSAVNDTPIPNGHGQTNAPSRLFTPNDKTTLHRLKSLQSRSTQQSDYPFSSDVISNIPVYDLARHDIKDTLHISSLQNELYNVLYTGPGVFVMKNFYTDKQLVKDVNNIFESIITSEQSPPANTNGSTTTKKKGDHFAQNSTANPRIWNSFQKHAQASPSTFVSYYSNVWLQIVSEAWLGPSYQVTAQVNIVKPGGKPQMPHRDYHLGFQTAEDVSNWPRGMQLASQFLTLQGAVAHSDMSLESGPTRFLPYSQLLEDGYMAWRRDDVKDFFHETWVSAPLEIGDAVFFNPALIHAAGENCTSVERGNAIDRSANLLQISSAFGRTMETIDRAAVVECCWNELRLFAKNRGVNDKEVIALVKAVTEGYPFPTNLDRRPPAPGGMAPQSETDVVLHALGEDWSKEEVMQALRQLKIDSAA